MVLYSLAATCMDYRVQRVNTNLEDISTRRNMGVPVKHLILPEKANHRFPQGSPTSPYRRPHARGKGAPNDSGRWYQLPCCNRGLGSGRGAAREGSHKRRQVDSWRAIHPTKADIVRLQDAPGVDPCLLTTSSTEPAFYCVVRNLSYRNIYTLH